MAERVCSYLQLKDSVKSVIFFPQLLGTGQTFEDGAKEGGWVCKWM